MTQKRNGNHKIRVTKNYRLFKSAAGVENREVREGRHKKLVESMKIYGFFWFLPIVCFRAADKKLYVKDGQHRLFVAELLRLEVYYVISEIDFDVAIVSSAGTPWMLDDYINRFVKMGREEYQEGVEFAQKHGLPFGIAFSLLSGKQGSNHVRNGTFSITQPERAEEVASLYTAMCAISPSLKKNQFLMACIAVFEVKGFNPNRLLGGAKKCANKLVSYSTRDAYLEMLENVYNYNRRELVGLKTLALTEIRKRSPIKKSEEGDEDED